MLGEKEIKCHTASIFKKKIVGGGWGGGGGRGGGRSDFFFLVRRAYEGIFNESVHSWHCSNFDPDSVKPAQKSVLALPAADTALLLMMIAGIFSVRAAPCQCFFWTCRKYIQVKLQGNTATPVTVAKPALSGQGAEFAFLNPGTQWVSCCCCFCYASLASGR